MSESKSKRKLPKWMQNKSKKTSNAGTKSNVKKIQK